MSMSVEQLVIRTSDRTTFRRCRRKWGFTSHLKRNLTQTEQKSYLWLGTGGHFALEDWYGYNYYQSPVDAFDAYVEAQEIWAKKMRGKGGSQLPHDYQEQTTLAKGILGYYLEWIKAREDHPTAYVDGEPQCEIRISIPLDDSLGEDLLDSLGGRREDGEPRVVYGCTLDRVIEIDGEYWVQDYKFFQRMDTNPLEYNQQMSSYIWAASTIYDVPIAGAMMWQFKKELVKPPRMLSNGTLSTDKNQQTTHTLYRQALIDLYGNTEGAPYRNIECLNSLAAKQTEDADPFIRRDRTYRTYEEQQAEGEHILMEVREMLTPSLPMYPNPTRDCHWDCEVRDICLMMNREDDWENYIDMHMTQRSDMDYDNRDDWREYLPR